MIKLSFSSEMKEELSKLNNLANKKEVQAEFIGYLISNNTSVIDNNIRFSTESEYNINRFSKLLDNLNIVDYDIEIQGKIYIITFNKKQLKLNDVIQEENNKLYITEIEDEDNYLKAVTRGIFLGAGSMNNPERKYHLEIALSNIQNAKLILKVLDDVGIKLKVLNGKNSYSLYIKEGEEISKFIAFIGANKSILKFEEIRVNRSMNNKVNRLVNCETANMNKTINAAVEQIEAIQHLKKTRKFEKLEDSLKEIAEVRLEHPNAPLSELGTYLKNPIGKSGVNYRLKRIIEKSKEN